jgi:hypothetical protein
MSVSGTLSGVKMINTNYVKELDNGNILLTPVEYANWSILGGIVVSTIELSCKDRILPWYIKFLKGIETNPDEIKAEGERYLASRNADNVLLEVHRDNGSCNAVIFSSSEIPDTITTLQQFVSDR